MREWGVRGGVVREWGCEGWGCEGGGGCEGVGVVRGSCVVRRGAGRGARVGASLEVLR